ncbi:uncharacterized protein LOC143026374 [Oratosquilla oratoria]|uniref:uncharacterized protein LOC143026374 n=1 Tax=Oratosquilla oratoria TaxID=337810 RepID=UPI003F773977
MWPRVRWLMWTGVLLMTTAAASYGPPRKIISNPFIQKYCKNGVCPTNAEQTSGCPSGGSCGGSPSTPVTTGPAKKYWWMGEDSPFRLPVGHQITHQESSCGSSGCTATITTCGGAGCPPKSSNPFLAPQTPSSQGSPLPPNPGSSIVTRLPSNPVAPPLASMMPMGQCPRAFVCVHWQLCQNGYVITDGSGNIDKTLREIPAQVSSQLTGCGAEMFCCQIPSYNPPSTGTPIRTPTLSINVEPPSQPSPPSETPPRQPATPVLSKPSPAPIPRPQRPLLPVLSGPVSTPSQQSPTPSNPRSTPLQPDSLTTPQRPSSPARSPSVVSTPARPATVRPNGPRPQPTFINQASPLAPTNPVGLPSPPRGTQLRPQPNLPPRPVVRPTIAPARQPSGPGPAQGILSNPLGLVSPPSPQPMGMPGMGMPMGTMAAAPPSLGGTCSAGTYCVARNQCNPYTGFIINDPNQLMAVWRDAPTVPELPCFIPGGFGIQDGICCQQSHPRPGMNGMPGAD